MKVVAFNGSANRDGNTAMLIEHVFSELRAADIETELVQLAGADIIGCTDCGGCARSKDSRCSNDDDIVNECIAKMLVADGIIIGSPVYFANCTASTQALIERAGYATRKTGNPLAHKVGAAVVAARRAGAMNAFDAINHFFQISEMVVIGSSYWNIAVGREPGDVQADVEGVQTMHRLGQNMSWVLTRLHGGA